MPQQLEESQPTNAGEKWESMGAGLKLSTCRHKTSDNTRMLKLVSQLGDTHCGSGSSSRETKILHKHTFHRLDGFGLLTNGY